MYTPPSGSKKKPSSLGSLRIDRSDSPHPHRAGRGSSRRRPQPATGATPHPPTGPHPRLTPTTATTHHFRPPPVPAARRPHSTDGTNATTMALACIDASPESLDRTRPPAPALGPENTCGDSANAASTGGRQRRELNDSQPRVWQRWSCDVIPQPERLK